MTWENMTMEPDEQSAAFALMDGDREIGHVFYSSRGGWEAWDDLNSRNLGFCYLTRKGAMIALRHKVGAEPKEPR